MCARAFILGKERCTVTCQDIFVYMYVGGWCVCVCACLSCLCAPWSCICICMPHRCVHIFCFFGSVQLEGKKWKAKKKIKNLDRANITFVCVFAYVYAQQIVQNVCEHPVEHSQHCVTACHAMGAVTIQKSMASFWQSIKTVDEDRNKSTIYILNKCFYTRHNDTAYHLFCLSFQLMYTLPPYINIKIWFHLQLKSVIYISELDLSHCAQHSGINIYSIVVEFVRFVW